MNIEFLKLPASFVAQLIDLAGLQMDPQIRWFDDCEWRIQLVVLSRCICSFKKCIHVHFDSGFILWIFCKTRLWFQIFFIFTPTWGNDPILRAYFSNGLVQPPTRKCQLESLGHWTFFFSRSDGSDRRYSNVSWFLHSLWSCG